VFWAEPDSRDARSEQETIMQNKLFLLVSMTAPLALAACVGGQALDLDDASADATEGDSATSAGAEDTGEPTDTDEEGRDTGTFVVPPDGGGTVSFECDVWSQDCPEGHKCMPWDNMGAGSWNATKCTPLAPNPAQVGDECVVEGTGVSGIDDCELAAMCWAVDPETSTGTCVSFCSGTEASPSCEDPATTCSITNGGALILCLPGCDPLAQACPEGQACYGAGGSFICAPNAAPADGGNYGDPCAFLNVCNPGLFCASAAGVPGCQGSEGCCSEFCSLEGGAEQCQGASGGQSCVAWFEEGQALPGYEDIGACFIPE
jgi:hypothetical protein